MKKILIVFVIFLFSCSSMNCENKEIIKEWEGKEIIFPASLKAKVFHKDTMCSNKFYKDYRLLLHVDSTGCSSCKLQLHHWKKFMKKYEYLNERVDFIYVAHVLNPFQMAIICKQNKFDHPIFYDIKGEMNKINKFPKNEQFRCFLLDKNNKVILIGNPVNDPKIEELFIKLTN